MAYPPGVLPINMTDATPQGPGTHPNLHNDTARAVNDTVAKLGADPADGNGTVQTAIYNLNAGRIAERIPNYIGTVDNSTTGNGFSLVAGSSVVATNVNGVAVVTFPKVMFSSVPPVVVVSNGDAVAGGFQMDVVGGGGTTTSNFQVKVWTAAGAPAASVTVRINWIALGPK